MTQCKELHVYKEKWELICPVLNARNRMNPCTHCDEWIQSLFAAARHKDGAEREAQRMLKELTSEMDDREVASLFADGRKVCHRANETPKSNHEKAEERFNEMLRSLHVEELEKKVEELTAENCRLSSHVSNLQDWNYCPRCSYNLKESPLRRNFQAAANAGANYAPPMPIHGENRQPMPATEGIPSSQGPATSSSNFAMPNQLQQGMAPGLMQQTAANRATYTGPGGASVYSHIPPGQAPSASHTTSSMHQCANAALPQEPWPCEPQADHASFMPAQHTAYSEHMVMVNATTAPQPGTGMQPPPPMNPFPPHTANNNFWQDTQFNTRFVLTKDNPMSTAMDIHDIRTAFGRIAVESDVPELTCDQVQERKATRISSSTHKRVIQVARRDHITNAISIDEAPIATLLNDDRLRDKKICVISAIGEKESGKSTLLNVFLRYLRHRTNEFVNNADWLASDENLQGFPSGDGNQAATAGMLIWPEVFLLPDANGDDVAVLLMDCEAAAIDTTYTADVFTTLALLTSSATVYNVGLQMNGETLSELKSLAYMSHLSAKDGDDGFFQRLLFVYYPHTEHIEEWTRLSASRCMLSGTAFKDSDLSQCLGEELTRILLDLFQPVDAWVLPHPRRQVEDSKFPGDLGDADEVFKNEIRVLTEHLFSPDVLQAKLVCGRQMTCSEWSRLFAGCFSVFENAKQNQSPLTGKEFLLVAWNAHYDALVKTLAKSYIEKVAQAVADSCYISSSACGSVQKYAADRSVDLEATYQRLLMECLEEFDNQPKCYKELPLALRHEYRDALQNDLNCYNSICAMVMIREDEKEDFHIRYGKHSREKQKIIRGDEARSRQVRNKRNYGIKKFYLATPELKECLLFLDRDHLDVLTLVSHLLRSAVGICNDGPLRAIDKAVLENNRFDVTRAQRSTIDLNDAPRRLASSADGLTNDSISTFMNALRNSFTTSLIELNVDSDAFHKHWVLSGKLRDYASKWTSTQRGPRRTLDDGSHRVQAFTYKSLCHRLTCGIELIAGDYFISLRPDYCVKEAEMSEAVRKMDALLASFPRGSLVIHHIPVGSDFMRIFMKHGVSWLISVDWHPSMVDEDVLEYCFGRFEVSTGQRQLRFLPSSHQSSEFFDKLLQRALECGHKDEVFMYLLNTDLPPERAGEERLRGGDDTLQTVTIYHQAQRLALLWVNIPDIPSANCKRYGPGRRCFVRWPLDIDLLACTEPEKTENMLLLGKKLFHELIDYPRLF